MNIEHRTSNVQHRMGKKIVVPFTGSGTNYNNPRNLRINLLNICFSLFIRRWTLDVGRSSFYLASSRLKEKPWFCCFDLWTLNLEPITLPVRQLWWKSLDGWYGVWLHFYLFCIHGGAGNTLIGGSCFTGEQDLTQFCCVLSQFYLFSLTLISFI